MSFDPRGLRPGSLQSGASTVQAHSCDWNSERGSTHCIPEGQSAVASHGYLQSSSFTESSNEPETQRACTPSRTGQSASVRQSHEQLQDHTGSPSTVAALKNRAPRIGPTTPLWAGGPEQPPAKSIGEPSSPSVGSHSLSSIWGATVPPSGLSGLGVLSRLKKHPLMTRVIPQSVPRRNDRPVVRPARHSRSATVCRPSFRVARARRDETRPGPQRELLIGFTVRIVRPGADRFRVGRAGR